MPEFVRESRRRDLDRTTNFGATNYGDKLVPTCPVCLKFIVRRADKYKVIMVVILDNLIIDFNNGGRIDPT